MLINFASRVVSIFHLLIFGSCLLSAAAYADYKPGPVVDVHMLDIAGVKLGMSYREAVDILMASYEVEEDEIKVIRMRLDAKPESPKLPAALRLNSEGTDGVKMGMPSKGWEISVSFIQILPSSEVDSVEVNSIEYDMAWTQENKKSLREAALSKYGEPTVDKQSMGLAWCIKPSTHWATCESEAVLEFSGTSLKLLDTRPNRLRIEAQNKRNSTKAKI